MPIDPCITDALHATRPPEVHPNVPGAAGRPATGLAADAAGTVDYPRMAEVLVTLLSALATPTATRPGPGVVTATVRAEARDRLGMLLRVFEVHLNFQLQTRRDGIHALRVFRLLHRISPGAFRRGLLARGLEAQCDCAQMTAADVIPGALARAVLARVQGPDDEELARVAARVARRADQVDRLCQHVQRGLSKLRWPGATGARRRRA